MKNGNEMRYCGKKTQQRAGKVGKGAKIGKIEKTIARW